MATKYFIQRPIAQGFIIWDGTNLAEFQDWFATHPNSVFEPTITSVDGVLTIARHYINYVGAVDDVITAQIGDGFAGGSFIAAADLVINMQEVPSSNPIAYTVAEE